jgi:hypothetical protein
MKKLLGIVVLGLLLSGCYKNESIVFICTPEPGYGDEKTFEVINDKVYKDNKLIKNLSKLKVNLWRSKIEFSYRYNTNLAKKWMSVSYKINLGAEKAVVRTKRVSGEEPGSVELQKCKKIEV